MTASDSRRRLLRAGGATLTAALAGCLGALGGEIEFDDEVPAAVVDHLASANNVDGSVTDRTDEAKLVIETGPGGNLSYDPALVAIDAGTTVTWEWQSNGHTVTSEQTPGETEFDTRGTNGDQFTETFDVPGNVLYYCNPHRGAGHLGAIIVK
jgi:halocyanin-like protein